MNSSNITRRQFLRCIVATTAAVAVARDGIDDPLTVTPDESDALLVNPGIGIETFWSFQGDRVNYDREVENYPRSSIAYFRYYWNELEEGEGQYNFEEIDFLLKKARKRGQDLALRFMGFNFGRRYPKYLMAKARGYEVELEATRIYPRPEKVPTWVPDFNDSYFLERLEAFLAAFGERYNGHPEFIRLDIGTVGRWGEWHCSGLKQVAMPTDENVHKIIDWYLKYFNKTPLCMLIGYVPGLRYAVSKGTGWRADSLGDWKGVHMSRLYPNNLKEANALDAWRRGLVTFEGQRDLADFVRTVIETGHTYDDLWNAALGWHGSSFNGKSTMLPTDQIPAMERFLKRCGYRFVLRRFTTSRKARMRDGLRVQMQFENVGVAPPYKNYTLAIRLKDDRREVTLPTDATLTKWLPGQHTVEARLSLPRNLKPGDYEAAVGLLDPYYNEPEVRLAIRTTDDNGWYPLCKIALE